MAKEQEIENRIKQDEQEKAIENLENLSEYGLCYTITEKIQEDIKTVLNMLKEKDAEIEKLKQALARNIAKNFTSIMKESAKSKEDLEMLNAGWQIELEKKDKIIDLMARAIDNYDSQLVINTFKDKEHVKQYFERKVKE